MRSKFAAVFVLAAFYSSQSFGDDICSAILSNGTYDKYDTLTTSQNFSLVYNTLCKSSIDTYDSATSGSGNLGISVIGVVDATLGGSTNSTNFSQRKDAFCALNYSNVSNNSTVISKIEVASKTIANAWENCVSNFNGFVSWVTVSKTLDAFTISMRNNGQLGRIEVYQIGHPGKTITCDGNAQNSSSTTPKIFETREVNIGCSKAATDTVQISMTTSAGTLKPVDLPGTVDVLGDLESQVRALQQSATILPKGAIISWFVKSGRIPDGWAVCDGSNGTPDLRQKFLRGVGTLAEVGSNGGSDSATIGAGDWFGSDYLHGRTPWAGGPNPVKGDHTISTVPSYVGVIYLMRM